MAANLVPSRSPSRVLLDAASTSPVHADSLEAFDEPITRRDRPNRIRWTYFLLGFCFATVATTALLFPFWDQILYREVDRRALPEAVGTESGFQYMVLMENRLTGTQFGYYLDRNEKPVGRQFVYYSGEAEPQPVQSR